MAKISTYATATPVLTDVVLGTDIGSSKATKNFTVQSIVDLASTGALGNLIPTLDNTYDLGSLTLQWRHLYLEGKAFLDEVEINETISGDSVITSDTLADATNGNIASTLAIKTYVDNTATAADLDFRGDDPTVAGAVDLDAETFVIEGTTDEIETSTVAASQTLTIGLTDDVTITDTLTISNTADTAAALSIVNSAAQNEISFTGVAATNIFSVTEGVMQIGTTSTAGASSLALFTENTARVTISSGGGTTINETLTITNTGNTTPALSIVNSAAQNEIRLTGAAATSNIFSETTGAMQIGTTSTGGASSLDLVTENIAQVTIDHSGNMSVTDKVTATNRITSKALRYTVNTTTGAGGTVVLDANSETVQIVDTSSAGHTFTLPAATESGMVFTFIATDSSNNITVQRAGADTIEGLTSITVTFLWSAPANTYRTLVADGVSLWSSM